MKKVIATVLSYSLIFTGACQKKQVNQRPAPSQEAKQDEVNQTAHAIDNNLVNSNQTASNSLTVTGTIPLNAIISGMLATKSIYIKDFDGNDADVNAYQLNPGKYYVLFKNDTADSYSVLNTSVGYDLTNGKDLINTGFDLNLKVYPMTGKISDFKGSALGSAKINESVTLDLNPKNLSANRQKLDDFYKRTKAGFQTASNDRSSIDAVSNFLFPTAFAADDFKPNDLKKYAIIFSSVSGLVYFIAILKSAASGYGSPILANTGAVTGAAGLVFWILFWIQQ